MNRPREEKPIVIQLPPALSAALTKRAQAMEMKRNALILMLLQEAMADWMRANQWRQ